ncbi:MAG: hypothetical protein ACYTBJ_05565 [Planctomycetota bacterium]|jgi:hypothetical protein
MMPCKWLVLLAVFLRGCQSEVLIRVANHSQVELQDVVVKFPRWQT